MWTRMETIGGTWTRADHGTNCYYNVCGEEWRKQWIGNCSATGLGTGFRDVNDRFMISDARLPATMNELGGSWNQSCKVYGTGMSSTVQDGYVTYTGVVCKPSTMPYTVEFKHDGCTAENIQGKLSFKDRHGTKCEGQQYFLSERGTKVHA